MILVLAEQRAGALNRASWEAIAAAAQLAAASGGLPIVVAVAGADVSALAAELAEADVAEVVALENQALEPYTADGYVAAFTALLALRSPAYVVLAHTYQARDFAPALAAKAGAPLITDVTLIKPADGGPLFARPVFQGRLVADVAPEGAATAVVTVQVGAFKADAVVRGRVPAPVSRPAIPVDAASIRQRPEAPFREARQAVDLTAAPRIVAVGRGIKAQEHLAMAEQLAQALGAEIGASRPVCDAGWLPIDRQVGSSGQTVAPKLYLALGVSGAIQHVVGMKGAQTIVAVNKDPDAPIFEVADYGIVGDLFEVVPAIIAELNR